MASLDSGNAAVDRIDMGGLATLVGYHLRRASSLFGLDFQRALAGTGIRQVLFGVLSIVAANPRISQGLVGRALGIQRANMVTLINELVDEGYIEREVAAGDRRAFELTLTAAGRTMLDRCLALILEHEEAMLAVFSASERDTLLTLLVKLAPAG